MKRFRLNAGTTCLELRAIDYYITCLMQNFLSHFSHFYWSWSY